jgi:predicted patatin/cPLA2 family phospholipase
MKEKTGLVLEGGGLRGMFTARNIRLSHRQMSHF